MMKCKRLACYTCRTNNEDQLNENEKDLARTALEYKGSFLRPFSGEQRQLSGSDEAYALTAWVTSNLLSESSHSIVANK